ncbi:MAG: isoaspartyl peptidase/L-asparaginase [candidate division WOR-3 bacterium]
MTFVTNCEGWPGLEAARAALLEGRTALDVVEAGIRPVEAEPRIDSVGRGGRPNLLGDVVCDAAVMDGDTLMVGAVAGLRGYLHAVSVARKVLERLPHVMLAGDGAARFAAEVGAEQAEMLTDEAQQSHEAWLQKHNIDGDHLHRPDVPLADYAWRSAHEFGKGGTVVFLVRAKDGGLAAGTSTSGWANGYPGRVGDSPIVGAGLYADSRYGACACTHTGEMSIRAATARSVVLYLKVGMQIDEACAEALRDLDTLKGGHLGALVIHALDREGRVYVVTNRDMGEKSSYYVWHDAMPVAEHLQAVVMRHR